MEASLIEKHLCADHPPVRRPAAQHRKHVPLADIVELKVALEAPPTPPVRWQAQRLVAVLVVGPAPRPEGLVEEPAVRGDGEGRLAADQGWWRVGEPFWPFVL